MKNLMASIFCIVMLITTIVSAAIPLTSAGPVFKANSVKPGEVWVAPSVIGLDWTSPEWQARLPVYTFSGERPLNTLISMDDWPDDEVDQAAGGVVVRPTASSSDMASAPAGGSLKVKGKFTTPLSNDGSTGADTSLQGIVWGWVHIHRCSDNALLGQGLTGDPGKKAGKFKIAVANPGSAGLYAEIFPATSAGEVRTPTGGFDSYATVTPCKYPSLSDTRYKMGTYSMYAGDGGVYRGAWMIYESIVNDNRNWGAWNFFANRLGSEGWVMPSVTVRFPYESWAHYHTGGEIHLPVMNDARSPDVIQHEYGHFAMYTVYGGWFSTYCPSPHYINGVSHVNCAWSEGWASDVPYMTHSDKTYTYANNFEVDEENATGYWEDGPAVEGRVTMALIDLQDSENEAGDVASGLLANLWVVFHHSGMNVNFHDFMADYKATYGYPSSVSNTLAHNTIVFEDL